MTEQNKAMKEYLKQNGIDAMPKYINNGSLGGCWRLYNLKINWWNNPKLWEQLTSLGFRDFDGKPLGQYSGNGGVFSLMARKS